MSTSSFSVEVAQVDGHAVVQFVGELDMATADLAEERGLEAVANSGGPVVLDLGAMSYCDSSGLRVLLRLQAEAGKHGREVVLRKPCSIVRRVLEVVGLDRQFPIEDEGATPPAA
jgi:anti-sigma B factor antagonist